MENKLSDDANAGKIGIDLTFKTIEDFDPEQVARRVEPLRELLDLRTKLSDLVGTLQGNEKLETCSRRDFELREAGAGPQGDGERKAEGRW